MIDTLARGAMSTHRPRLVASQPALRRLIDHLGTVDRIGVDTEFHAERRYRPELMLVQIADDQGNAWLADPRAIDLRPLAAAMSGRIWVAFAADTDVALLTALGGRPTAIHDPQRLAGLAGHDWPRSLADLCHAELGQQIDKTPALTDWSSRPLTDAQVAYAADDARLALRLWDALEARVPPERVRWAIEDGAALLARAGEPTDPDRRWLRLHVAPRLDLQARAALHRLAAWRETQAEATNQPPWSVLPDAHMLDLARRPPADLQAILTHRRMHKGSIRKFGQQWLTMIHAPPEPDTPPAPPHDRALRTTVLNLLSHTIGHAQQIAPRLLLTDEWTARVVEDGPAALTGWRSEIMLEPLLSVIIGESSIRLPDWCPTLHDD